MGSWTLQGRAGAPGPDPFGKAVGGAAGLRHRGSEPSQGPSWDLTPWDSGKQTPFHHHPSECHPSHRPLCPLGHTGQALPSGRPHGGGGTCEAGGRGPGAGLSVAPFPPLPPGRCTRPSRGSGAAPRPVPGLAAARGAHQGADAGAAGAGAVSERAACRHAGLGVQPPAAEWGGGGGPAGGALVMRTRWKQLGRGPGRRHGERLPAVLSSHSSRTSRDVPQTSVLTGDSSRLCESDLSLQPREGQGCHLAQTPPQIYLAVGWPEAPQAGRPSSRLRLQGLRGDFPGAEGKSQACRWAGLDS
nr:ADP-ribosylation factor-like protein 13B isoform X1 [Aotus nancymaae]